MLKTALLLLLFVSMTVGASGEEAPEDKDGPKPEPGPADSQEQEKPGPIDEDADGQFITTDSGLKYRMLRKSDNASPSASDSVEVHYKGWLDDGSIFDSSYRRASKISFPLSGVIKGWTEGLQLVGEGGMIELEIPAELGYGARGAGGVIPPNATLHFVVELFKIK
ncbi:FKBP-type 22 kDa peptidyl-prolyl cis-trans isomerase [Novipirellula galeiformis]|uniref:Peptidyl-prolyl cis-trans isomerase n=1 Tax=Novipirellula galeiformis TaxID=2528004 RepID=A0A5C6CUQ4_9BACT|nr:FKBP-type peptidyl-prolyl cis-trans isomerase [Novipirellula galeiformis]TWU27141.1 FKBP-type 22 kDa peptidyl-prolyl cis-trans isomerase [Novipirellula galeiformis]